MANLRTIITRQVFSLVAIVSLVGLPLTSTVALAEDPSTCTAPAASSTFHPPNGADSSTFTYNCTTGLYDNAHFSYDPSTGVRTQKDLVYTCDPASNTYKFTTWDYSPPQAAFYSTNHTTSQPPAGATVIACPPPPPPPAATSPNGSAGTTNGSGSGSTNSTNTNVSNNTDLSNVNNLNVNNGLTSTSTSGNAIALGNTTVGDVSSGDSAVVANEMNLLQSAVNVNGGGQPVTFVANINGDVNGDLLLDPATISSIQPASNTSDTNINNDLTINNTTNATLNNTLDLSANSGNATANDNTTTGNVSSGNANVVANVVNAINSAITAGQSFFGVININGNLNGDILLPPDFVNQLLAANVPTVNIVAPSGNNSTNSNTTTVNNSTTVSNQTNQSINNNVNATATSGTATANDNTGTGNVGSGNATTTITAFNLTGSRVIGGNDLLVFVNVVGGSWVGLIVNAPPGANVAELGGAIVTAGPNSTNSATTDVNNTSTSTNNTTEQINNNINLAAASGNATANRNTNVGNVKTGDAKGAVNLLNVENSTLTLSNWFGILFINVFGTWHGSFGVNTHAGDPIATNSSTGTPGSFFAAPAFGFAPKASSGTNPGYSGNAYPAGAGLGSGSGSSSAGTPSTAGAILAAVNKANHRPSVANTPGHVNWVLIVGSISLFALYLAGERYYAVRKAGLKLA